MAKQRDLIDGDLYVARHPLPVIREPTGDLSHNVTLFLVFKDQKYDRLELEPLGWRAAERIFGADLLHERVQEVRGVYF